MAEMVEGILVPTLATLSRYGMTMEDWVYLNTSRSNWWVCGCCGKKPSSGRLYIDHEHVRGWKQMPPEERRKYVRGLACYICNRFILNHRVSAQLLRDGAEYLQWYEDQAPLGEEG